MFRKVFEPETGDLLRVKRKAGYYHFGIATGKDTVVHFTGANGDLNNDEGGIMIRETSLSVFAKEDSLESENYTLSPFDQETIVQRARNFVGQTQFKNKNYNFFTNNCEHFARYVFTGKAESLQVREGAKYASIAAGVIGVTIGAVATAVGISKHNENKK